MTKPPEAPASSVGAGARAAVNGNGVIRGAAWGAAAGIGASLVMAMYAMLAALTYQHTGFFTPLYHIASALAPGEAMMRSMESAAAGGAFTFIFGPALLGAMIHMITGAAYGAIFGVIARLLRWHGATLVGAALVWSLAVFAVSTWIGLPLAAGLLGGGEPVANMATMVGYPTFIVEHLLYGAVLGMLLASPLRSRHC